MFQGNWWSHDKNICKIEEFQDKIKNLKLCRKLSRKNIDFSTIFCTEKLKHQFFKFSLRLKEIKLDL